MCDLHVQSRECNGQHSMRTQLNTPITSTYIEGKGEAKG